MAKITKTKIKARLVGVLLVFLIAPVVLNLTPVVKDSDVNVFRIKIAKGQLTPEQQANRARLQNELAAVRANKDAEENSAWWGGLTEGAKDAAKSTFNAIGGAILTVASTAFLIIFGTVINLAVKLIGGLLILESKLLFIVIGYNGFIDSVPVQKGWLVVRDMANMFFVLILLAISIATILRVESYNIKKLLPKVLLMAILVNFSRLICGLIIDFSQVILMTFAAGYASITGSGAGGGGWATGGRLGEGKLMSILGINKMLMNTVSESARLTVSGEGTSLVNTSLGAAVGMLNAATSGILAIILLTVALIVVFVMLIVFLIRIIMLWLLIILSPLAFVLSAFPSGQRYASQWWSEFAKYVIIGPVMAFFLWLTFSIADQNTMNSSTLMGVNPAELNTAAQDAGGITGSATFLQAAGGTEAMLSFLVAIGMLIAGLVIAQQAGVAGGQLAGGAVGKIKGAAMWTGRMAGKGAKLPFSYAGRRINEAIGDGRLTAWANPRAMWRGLQERRTALYERAQKKADAGAHETWEKVFTGTSMPYRSQAAYAEETEFAKDFSFMDKEEMANTAVSLMKGGDNAENRAKKRALIRAAAEQGYLDDLMAHPEMKKNVLDVARKFATSSPEAAKYMEDTKLIERMENGEWYGWDQLHMFLQDYVGTKKNGELDEDGVNTINSLEGIGASVKHPEYAGHSTYRAKVDGGNDGMEMETMWDQKDENGVVVRKSGSKRAISEFFKWPGRNKMSVAPHGIMNFGENGFGLDQFSKDVMTAAFAGQEKRVSEHSQSRVWTMIQGGSGDNMNWRKEEELADLTQKKDESEEGYQRRLAALAHMSEIIGKDGRKAIWEKVGGKGNEGQYIVNIDGKEETISASQLTQMLTPDKIREILSGKKINLKSELDRVKANVPETEIDVSANLDSLRTRSQTRQREVLEGWGEAEGDKEKHKKNDHQEEMAWHEVYDQDIKGKDHATEALIKRRAEEQAGGKDNFDRLSDDDKKKALGRATGHVTQDPEVQKSRSNAEAGVREIVKEKITEAEQMAESGQAAQALEHIVDAINGLESALKNISPKSDEGKQAKNELVAALKQYANLRSSGGDQIAIKDLLSKINHNIGKLGKETQNKKNQNNTATDDEAGDSSDS